MQKEEDAPRSPRYPLASVDSALKLLLYFEKNERITLSEASANLGVAHSTAHRLLAMLAYHGFVQQVDGSRVYVAGPALIEIGLSVVRGMDLRSLARPLLDELAELFGETAHLAVLDGATVRYLDCVESQRAVRVAARTGTVLPANCTSVGKALLATFPDDELEAMFDDEHALTALTANSIAEWDDFKRAIKQARAEGVSTNNGESEEGVTSVGVAVRDRTGRGIAGMSLATPSNRMNEHVYANMVVALRDCATRLERQLGD